MELAVVYKLNPPTTMTGDSPITYTCGECEEVIMAYNTESHAKTHGTSLYVLGNRVEPTAVKNV